ncbi:TetR/AcrR family transcriptional regulator [Actinoplanes sp. NEAU-A12]|uniref:TetR/AcrR family transcriptional regulator n=1 Tax=Actinoplanes sandaracinus TaxID=3045177 RepID=A0ABT6WXG9_9ACTN|nr:TetR/AcrR family transcriptional regulator [Actinoplanes sandaracinus]MDI6104301.1 TetR/AcrR family transcriptional regulator [Actinoplanes sandaracinus]
MNGQGRSNSSRRRLVEATARLLRERGLQGVRIRDVASYAGMSAGSVLYHFANTDDLLFAVHQDAVANYLASRTAAAHGSPDPRSRLIQCFKAGVPIFADATTIELLYEVHGLARRSHRHAELLSELWRTEVGLYVEIVRDGIAAGVFRTTSVESAAQALMALEDGLVLHLTSRNEMIDSARAMQTFQSAAAEILHCPPLAGNSRIG